MSTEQTPEVIAEVWRKLGVWGEGLQQLLDQVREIRVRLTRVNEVMSGPEQRVVVVNETARVVLDEIRTWDYSDDPDYIGGGVLLIALALLRILDLEDTPAGGIEDLARELFPPNTEGER